MRKKLSVLSLAVLALVLTALPAAGEEPFPPADWQQTARFSGDYLHASFEGAADGYRYVSIGGYAGSFRLPGTKGKGIQDELVTVSFDMGSCNSEGTLETELHLLGSLFTGGGPEPVYEADTHAMLASFGLAGIERTYKTVDCSWENRTIESEASIAATFTIDGQFATNQCKGNCFAVCEFTGTMKLTYDGSNFVMEIPFDTVSEGFGGSRRGEIFWWSAQ